MIKLGNKQLCESCFAETASETCEVCGYNKNTAAADPTILPCGSVLMGRYVVGHVIGKGGFGITYLAYDSKMEKTVAIKEFYPFGLAVRSSGSPIVSVTNAEAASVFQNGAEKFYNEAKLVSKFNGNPNIVSVYEFFYENDTVYFSMEYLKGETLKSYVNKHGTLTAEQAVFVADAVSNALMAAHSSNVLHRDISPDNIMLCDDGTVKLLDFGAARQVMAERSQSLSVILKPGFAPLEQYQKKGRQGPWTDIYSFGATLYYSMTLDTLEDPMTRMEDDSEFLANSYNINEDLWEIIEKATMLRITDRYADIFEFRRALENTEINAVPIIDAVESTAAPQIIHTAQPIGTVNYTASKPNVTQNVTIASPAVNDAAEQTKEKAAVPVKLIIGIIAAVVLVAGVIAAVVLLGGKEKDTSSSDNHGAAATTTVSSSRKKPDDNKKEDVTTTEAAVKTRLVIDDPDNYLSSTNEDTITRYAGEVIAEHDCNVLVSIQKITSSYISKNSVSDLIYYNYFDDGSDGIAVIYFENSDSACYKICAYGSHFDKYSDKLAAMENYATTQKLAYKTYFNDTLQDIADIRNYEISENEKSVTTAVSTTKKEETTTPKETATETTTKKTTTTTTKASSTEPTEVEIGGKNYPVDIYSLELNGLGLSSKDITNIKYMKNLNYVSLCDNNLTDVSVLGKLPNLQNVQLHNNNISDISFVKNLDKLDCFAAANNNISDISPLKGKKKITQLWLDDNPISDLSPISGLTNLVAVGFTRCPIDDLDDFAKLTKLETACLEGTGVCDISGLKKCTNLKYLYLGSCNIVDVSALSGSKGFVELYLNGNPIEDDSIETFEGLTMAPGGYICLNETELDTDEQLVRIWELIECSGTYYISIFPGQTYEA